MDSTHVNKTSACQEPRTCESVAADFVEEKEDSGVFDFGCQNSCQVEDGGFSFKSFSFELVQNWSQCSFSNSNFQSVSLQHVPSIDRRSSAWLVGINIQSMILGTSVLSFPYAFVNTGIWAIPLVVWIGAASSFSGSLLQDCLYQKSCKYPWPKRVRKSYLEISSRAWKSYGKPVMELIVFLSILRNVIILILLTNLTVEVFDGFIFFDKRLITVLWAIGVLPFLFIKRVSSLAWISFFGLSLYLISLLAVLVHCVLECKIWSFSKLHLEFRIEKFGIAAGIIINSFSQHLSFPPVEGSMRMPEKYSLTLHTSFGINIIAKVFLGISGAMAYGDVVCQSVTSNLTEKNISIPSDIGIAFFAYFTLPMQSFVVLDLIDSKYFPHFTVFQNSNCWCWLVLSRSLVLLPCLFIAVLIPQFGLLVSFVGSIRGSLICLVLPPLFYLTIHHNKISIYRKVQCLLIIITGIALGGVGAYSSSKALVQLWL